MSEIMPQISQNISRQRSSYNQKFGAIQLLVIILSFISVISRIIYCTYASWLVFTTYDCIPCHNITNYPNQTSGLFIAHHSSAVFNTIRGLNIKPNGNESKDRVKRSHEEVSRRDLTKRSHEETSRRDLTKTSHEEVSRRDGKYFSSNDSFESDYYETKQKAETLAKEAFDKIVFQWSDISNESQPQDNWMNERAADTRQMNHFFEEEAAHERESNQSDDERTQTLTYFPDNNEESYLSEETIESTANMTQDNDSISNTMYDVLEEHNNVSNNSIEDLHSEEISYENDFDSNAMTIILNNPRNESALSRKDLDSRRQQKSLNDNQEVMDTSFVSSKKNVSKDNEMKCSQECAGFLSVELKDPKVRKWAMLLITCIMYLYALIMICILIGACFSYINLLIIATFIEGAKLFAGFVLIIIDSFNGKEVHFNLIDVKINVNEKGNGWAADFSYSEYLLDIIIFLLSSILCVKVFKNFRKRNKKISSIEDLQIKGTFRERYSTGSCRSLSNRS